jgi:ubiquinone/menaquinone biosynthesis C-methylase UbiE
VTEPAVAAYVSRPVNPHRLAALKAHAGHRVLDVGCGNGAYVEALLPDRDTCGVDWTTFPSWSVRTDRFVLGLADRLPFQDKSFDTVSCFETLEHLEDPAVGLRELHRVARSTVILTVPNCEMTAGQRASGLIYHHWIDPTHRSFWSFPEFVSLVQDCGFQIISSSRINEIDLRPLVAEAWGGGRLGGTLVKAVLKLKKQRRYGMTSLVVARPV